MSDIPVEVYEAATRALVAHELVRPIGPNPVEPDAYLCMRDCGHETRPATTEGRLQHRAAAVLDAVWPLAVEAAKQQYLAERRAELQRREAGIPDDISDADAHDRLDAHLATLAARRQRERDAIGAEYAKEFDGFAEEYHAKGEARYAEWAEWTAETIRLRLTAPDTTEETT